MITDKKVRVRRTNTHIEFSCTYPAEARSGLKGETTGVIRVARIFHPVRGEETQIEIEVGRTFPNSRSDRKKETRHDSMTAHLNAPPVLAEQMACAVLGTVWAPPTAKQVGSLNTAINQYNPRKYEQWTEKERAIAMEAFEAGRQYEASLKP